MPAELEDYLFDLRGYLVLHGALSPREVAELNAAVDDLFADQDSGELDIDADDSCAVKDRWYWNVVEAGEVYERLIDHRSWISHLHRYIGNEDKAVLEESIAMLRPTGGSSQLHSGAHKRRQYTQFRYHNGQFRCGQINIMIALNDWCSGDGVTMLIPGSHKSNIIHPAFSTTATDRGGSLNTVDLVGPQLLAQML